MIIRKFISLIRIFVTAIKRRKTSVSAAKQLSALASGSENPFFVIVMPGSLHILKVFMRYAPKNVNFVLVLNGVDQWERSWVQAQFSSFRTISLDETLWHGSIIDLVVDHFKKPFGMIDYDCFVFNPYFFEEIMVLPEDAFLNAFFCYKNENLKLDIPQTYFLFFNPPIISLIKKKFHINSNSYEYKTLSRKIKESLISLGVDSTHLPEPTPLIDTFRVILLLATIEGYKVNFIKQLPVSIMPNSEIYHIGAVHFNNKTNYFTFFKGSYFWRFCLEHCEDRQLINYYYDRYGSVTSKELLTMNPKFASYGSTKIFIEFVDQIVNRKIHVVNE